MSDQKDFQIVAIDSDGREQSLRIQADDESSALEMVKNDGYYVHSIEQAKSIDESFQEVAADAKWGRAVCFGAYGMLAGTGFCFCFGFYICGVEIALLGILTLCPFLRGVPVLGFFQNETDRMVQVYLDHPHYLEMGWRRLYLWPFSFLLFPAEAKALLHLLMAGIGLDIGLELLTRYVVTVPSWGFAAKCSFWGAVGMEALLTFYILPYMMLVVVGLRGLGHQSEDIENAWRWGLTALILLLGLSIVWAVLAYEAPELTVADHLQEIRRLDTEQDWKGHVEALRRLSRSSKAQRALITAINDQELPKDRRVFIANILVELDQSKRRARFPSSYDMWRNNLLAQPGLKIAQDSDLPEIRKAIRKIRSKR